MSFFFFFFAKHQVSNTSTSRLYSSLCCRSSSPKAQIKINFDKASHNFTQHKVVSSWFKEGTKDFIIKEPLVWIDIERVPLRTWSKVNFQNIVSKYDSIVYMDDDLEENLFTNRVCIETNLTGIISDDASSMGEVNSNHMPSPAPFELCDFIDDSERHDQDFISPTNSKRQDDLSCYWY